MSLNKQLMEQFTKETGDNPTYNAEGATYHTLRYVDWLEKKLSATEAGCDQQPTTGPSTPLKGSDGRHCCRHCGFYTKCCISQ